MILQPDFFFFLFTTVFVMAIMLLAWMRKKYSGSSSRWALFALLGLYFLGLAAASWQGREKDGEVRVQLKRQAEAIARTINRDEVRALAFTASDSARPEFEQLCSQMMAYENSVNATFGAKELTIYSMVMRNNLILFGPEGIARNSPYASPPGTVYRQPAASLKRLFSNGPAFTEGPYTDEYGTFVSAFAPVSDPATDKLIMVVGIDIDYNEVRALISRQALFAYLCVLLLAAVLIMAAFLHAKGAFLLMKFRLRSEGINVVMLGLSLTLIIALVLQQNSLRNRNALFNQVAEPVAKSLCKSFMNLRDFQVTALVRYFQGPSVIGREAFHSILAPMFRISGKQTTFGWIIPVAAGEKEKMEMKARAEGLEDFSIWQPDANGQKIAATTRSTYFPFWYFEPLSVNTPTPGFDPGADPKVLATIEKAVKTGLPAVTDPIVFPMDKSKQERIMIFQPVYKGDAKTRTLLGLIVALVSPEQFIKKAISWENTEQIETITDIYQLSAGQTPRLFGCTLKENISLHLKAHADPVYNILDKSAVIYPVFVFDKTYAILVFPATGSLSSLPVYSGFAAVAIGVLLTILVTFLTLILSKQNETLALEVEVRTGELRKSEVELRELNATKDKFFSIIAHDLRSPFNAFLGFTQIMAEEMDSMTRQEIKTIVASMRKSATNVYSLLENLLEWSMMQRGITKMDQVPVHVEHRVAKNLEILLEAARRKEIEISLDIPGDMTVRADVHMFDTVIRNLVFNAVKFTPRNGKIMISAKQSGAGMAEVAVGDTGIGMDKELIGKLFMINEQSRRSGTDGEPSIGLGLFICRDFIEMHGGRIWADSEPGTGSTFHFTLPYL